jgi:hypothetical protein
MRLMSPDDTGNLETQNFATQRPHRQVALLAKTKQNRNPQQQAQVNLSPLP